MKKPWQQSDKRPRRIARLSSLFISPSGGFESSFEKIQSKRRSLRECVVILDVGQVVEFVSSVLTQHVKNDGTVQRSRVESPYEQVAEFVEVQCLDHAWGCYRKQDVSGAASPFPTFAHLAATIIMVTSFSNPSIK